MLFLVETSQLEGDIVGAIDKIVPILKTLYDVILVAVPIIMIVLGTVDLLKVVSGGDEKDIKGATGMLVKRMLYGAATFLVLLIVQLVISIVTDDAGWSIFWRDDIEDQMDGGDILTCPHDMLIGEGSEVTITTNEPIENNKIEISQNFEIKSNTGKKIIIKKSNDVYVENLYVNVTAKSGEKDNCTITLIGG